GGHADRPPTGPRAIVPDQAIRRLTSQRALLGAALHASYLAATRQLESPFRRRGGRPNARARDGTEKQPRRADVRTRHLSIHKDAMLTREDIEGFLDRLTAEGASYDEVEQGLWVVRPGGNLEIDVVVHYSPPVVLLRVKVMNVPA